MQSQKYYMQALVSWDMLCEAVGGSALVFGWLLHRFKEQIAEKNMGLIAQPKLRVMKPDLLEYAPEGMLRVQMVARVVPIQRLENV